MRDGPRGRFVRAYIDRVVNQRDVTAVDELVARDYRGGGHGWPATFAALRQFYVTQALERPDWRIDVQDTIEVGEVVVVHALAGGTVTDEGVPRDRRVEWLACYRVADGLIREIDVIELVDV